MPLLRILILFTLCLPLQARPLPPEEVPEPLQPWIDWVLHGEEEKTCPFLYDNGDQHRCAWPTGLELKLNEKSGDFTQAWQVYAESWVPLPGDTKRWPQDVTLNGKPAPVAERNGTPHLRLAPGNHRIRGQFLWERLPETLPIPPDTGLIRLSVRGSAVPFPEMSDKGQLWLRERDRKQKGEGHYGDRLEIRVYRQVIDDIPLRLLTHIDLEVSGARREILLGPALAENFIPLRLQSPLPARLEPDGRLRVQLRPGRWTLELDTRHPEETRRLPLPATPEPWPREEIWTFNARNHLRLVEVTGAAAIDPRQTNLPAPWRNLPAYRMQPGEALELNVIRRGNPEPEPNRLSLQRELFLDFDGGGYTLRDDIRGTLTQGWRLEVGPEIALGRAAVDGNPQFITRLPGSEKQGVELRRGDVNLTADSRYEGAIGSLPALGWEEDFQQVRTTLHLPPGWKLLSVTGVDNLPPTWLQRWTLLDLFLVLITALAVTRLWGRPWGVLALVTLGLTWHQPLAPQYVWLNILAAVALLRVLPAGRFRRLTTWYRNLSLLTLILVAVPFAVHTVRTGLYPQLERPWRIMETAIPLGEPAPSIAPAPAMDAEEGAIYQEKTRRKEAFDYYSSPSKLRRQTDQIAALQQVDPLANIQTGPGLPEWQWDRIPLSWNGPLEQGQRIGLTLLSPTVNLILNFLRVLLIGALVLRLLDIGGLKGGGLLRRFTAQTGLFLPALLLFALSPQPAQAHTPDAKILAELKGRLLEPPACLPNCAQSPRMRFEILPTGIQGRIEIHAQGEVAVPLPGQGRHWLPALILVDGKPPDALYRTESGNLWIRLPAGRHQISFSGPLPPRESVQLPLPLKPHRLEYRAQGWEVEGIHENGLADDQLQLTRIRNADEKAALPTLDAGVLPPFVQVERTLYLGVTWGVETRIRRLSPKGSAAVLELPLLKGESVVTEGVRTKEGKVLVNIPADGTAFSWQSRLEIAPELQLTAPQTTAWAETWRLNANTIWHIETSGIPVIHPVNQRGNWLPEWRPWPGESISLQIVRPEGVAGNTLTLDNSLLRLKPGQRSTEAHLSLTLRSSQGGQHSLTLPPDAQLQSVAINGRNQPIRLEEGRLTLPIAPGRQQIHLTWRQSEGIGTLYTTPPVDLGAPSVNSLTALNLGHDRWTLFTGGPMLGPAVLFWGVLIVILLIAEGLGRTKLTPLKNHHWLLLGIGLSQAPLESAVLVVGWLLALGARARLKEQTRDKLFNLIQTGLGLLTLLALASLFIAIQQGLLGLPDMQISGNGSSAHSLNWYQDRAEPLLPRAWVISVPLLVYRLLMLAWALWLAFALLKWLRWGWNCFSTHGHWRQTALIRTRKSRKKADTPKEEKTE